MQMLDFIASQDLQNIKKLDKKPRIKIIVVHVLT